MRALKLLHGFSQCERLWLRPSLGVGVIARLEARVLGRLPIADLVLTHRQSSFLKPWRLAPPCSRRPRTGARPWFPNPARSTLRMSARPRALDDLPKAFSGRAARGSPPTSIP